MQLALTGWGVEARMAEVSLRHEARKPFQDGDYYHVFEYRIQSRANIGAAQNQLRFASANLATTIENQKASRSTLMDLDVSSAMSNSKSKQVLMPPAFPGRPGAAKPNVSLRLILTQVRCC